MFLYYIIFIVLIFAIYLGKSKTLESFYSIGTKVDDSEISDKEKKESEKKNSEKVAKTFEDGLYFTENRINYQLIDDTIDELNQNYNKLKYNSDNFHMNVGSVYTSTNPSDEPDIKIGGNFPDNVLINFVLPPPTPGKMGEQGEQGDQGEKGKTGKRGSRGIDGPYGNRR